MTALITDISAAWFLFLTAPVAGIALILWVRRDIRDEALASEAERVISSPFVMTPEQRVAARAHLDERLAPLRMAIWADRLADPEVMLFGIPSQRDPLDDVWESAHRDETGGAS